MRLHELSPNIGSTKNKKRIGRGLGSGKGRTAGRGQKGQKSRSGDRNLPPFFEGGQTPFLMRIPKRGFKNPNKKEYEIVNIEILEKYFEANEEITPQILKEKGIIHCTLAVKILGNGEITKPLKVKAHKFSKSAQEKIQSAGGSVEIIEQ
ncbi:MAG: 50S ribosomal protein L15 [Aquificae bacterium]|nr:50S ribosomal protein L15 [Aquificota bacterium]